MEGLPAGSGDWWRHPVAVPGDIIGLPGSPTLDIVPVGLRAFLGKWFLSLSGELEPVGEFPDQTLAYAKRLPGTGNRVMVEISSSSRTAARYHHAMQSSAHTAAR